MSVGRAHSEGCLARISHTLSAADAECGPSASLRSFGLLDVGSTTPSSASLRAPCIRATLCVLATRGCEKCGLAPSSADGLALSDIHDRQMFVGPSALPLNSDGSGGAWRSPKSRIGL